MTHEELLDVKVNISFIIISFHDVFVTHTYLMLLSQPALEMKHKFCWYQSFKRIPNVLKQQSPLEWIDVNLAFCLVPRSRRGQEEDGKEWITLKNVIVYLFWIKWTYYD